MYFFEYRSEQLYVEDVPVEEIISAVGTPVYIYSSAAIERHCDVFRNAFDFPVRVFYAVKANANVGVLKTIARRGFGADVVSEGEIRKAVAAGVPPQDVVFSGVGKTAQEIGYAIDLGVYQINIESEDELEKISKIASAKGRTQDVAFRINPDVVAGGHPKIETGGRHNKFGLQVDQAIALYGRAASLPGVRAVGLAMHLGSQIFDVEALRMAFMRLRDSVQMIQALGLSIARLDLGGGLGAPYQKPFDLDLGLVNAYAKVVSETVGDLGLEIGFEPGRVIVANAGILITSVLYVNRRSDRRFLVVDAAMNDLLRPALYGAEHDLWPVREVSDAKEIYDVVGPICETSDTFATQKALPKLEPGDALAFKTAGAYAASMGSNYNQRRLAAEVLIRHGSFAVTRLRQSYAQLSENDRLPLGLTVS